MKYIGIIILMICSLSLGAMDKPLGKRSAKDALPETREFEKRLAGPAIKHPKSILELLPKDLRREIVKFLTTARGPTKRARLDNAAENIRSFFRTNRLFKSFEKDQGLINYIISELAKNYADGDQIAAAIALGTESARTWLTAWLTDPLIDCGAKIERSRSLHRNFIRAVDDNRLNVLRFLLSTYSKDTYFYFLHNTLPQALKISIKDKKISVLNTILSHPMIQADRTKLVNNVKVAESGQTTTPLYYAIEAFSPQIVEILINAGAEVNLNCLDSNPPLVVAAQLHHEDRGSSIVQLLLSAAANPNVASDEGTTPLMTAALNGNLGNVQLLLNAGAAVNTVDNDNHTALWHAEHPIHAIHDNTQAIIKILRDNGAE